MGLVIGMDEAGYGPNLGPLVVTATVWEVPDPPHAFDFWSAFEDVLTCAPEKDDARLHLADSKDVYSPSKGLATLERGVLTAALCCDLVPAGFRELCGALTPGLELHEPWFDGRDARLPTCEHPRPFSDLSEQWTAAGESCGARLLAVRSDVVLTRRFNDLLDREPSKGVALSRISLKLLREVWNPDDGRPTLVVCDKHGGRNRYDGLLDEVLDGRMIFRQEESKRLSRYRIGETEVRFQMQAEQWLPVALASMFGKYVREVAMDLFNAFWAEHVPDLKPTKGYPTDARRFREDVEKARQELGITDEVFWRSR